MMSPYTPKRCRWVRAPAKPLFGLATIEKGKKRTIPVDPPVYGFFRMPYQPIEPPASL